MNALVKLYILKLKGQIRNVFSKPSSAIITSLIILLYGGGFIGMLMTPDMTMSMMNIQNIQSAIMISIGFTGLMVGSLLMQKRSALFYENDAFYLFSGPFKRSQVMHYLMSNTILSSLLFGAISMLMLVFLGSGIAYSFIFLFVSFLLEFLISFFFIVLKDYTYLLSIQNERMKHSSRIVASIFIIMVLIVFGMQLAQSSFDVRVAGSAFINSELFYFIPLFGWAKLAMVSIVSGDVAMVVLGSVLVIAAAAGIFVLMSRYQGNFVEKAMQDAEEFTALYKEVKSGKRSSLNEKKVKNIKSDFKEGANAIFSKNMLMMRKTNDFIRMQDILILAVYLILALVVNLGFLFYVYMMIFWLFASVQSSDFMRDMNNYQIYLIPDHPFKKLWNVIKATMIKLWIVAGLGVVAGGLLFQENVVTTIQYFFMICGYALIFISGTVLSLRILKSRSNAIVENMLRMLVILISCIPSFIVLFVLITTSGTITMNYMNIVTIVNLMMNFIISFMILYLCRNMMNGRELKSE